MKFSTRAIRIGEEPDFQRSGDVVVPLHLSTTFARKDPEKATGGYEYTRTGNPTRQALEKKLASIENGKFAYAFSSGLSAETTILLSLLKEGDEIIASDDLYGGTRRIFESVLKNFNVSYKLEDFSKRGVKNKMRRKTKMLWMETPSNPLMKIIDIKEISDICKEENVLLVVDNTFASPFFQNPLDLGADVVVHSTTKYINGHSDSLGGAAVINDPSLSEKIRFNQNAVGAVLSPFDSFLTLRGIKTLEVRMERHEKNAMQIARYLSENESIEKVLYPGLESHPGHDIAKKQMRGFGGMLSFYVKGRDVKSFLRELRFFSIAESLGGVESLIEIPYYMTHASIPENERMGMGISPNLVRMSVGLENVDDLLEDLKTSLAGL
jgi:cystathionine gamma-lyase